MITQVEIPTAEQLQPLVDEALESVDSETFILNHLAGIKTTLEANPRSYRAYGPYWWAVKELLVTRAFIEGEEDEPATKDHFNFDSLVVLLCAAWAYQNHQHESGTMTSTLHYFDIDGDEYEYSLEDLDMEALAINH